MPPVVTDPPLDAPTESLHVEPSLALLLQWARAGETAGVAGLYDRFASRMLRVAWRLTGSMEDAEDVVHDVFVRLPQALERYAEQGSIESWLAQVTARASLMHLRSHQRRRETTLVDAAETPTRERTDLRAEYGELEQRIAELPLSLREVFVLREIEGFTHDEIADLLHITVGASRVRLSRALDALRLALGASQQAARAATTSPTSPASPSRPD